jgi:hypothetical protein
MPADFVSKKTRHEFREYFVGTTLRVIDDAFDAAGIPFAEDYNPPESGARRSRVEQYYHSLDFANPSDVRRLLQVYEDVLAELDDAATGDALWAEAASKTKARLIRWLEKDGFKIVSGRVSSDYGASHLDGVGRIAARVDAPELQRQIDRMRSAADTDPALAVGTAKELIETTCKTVLADRAIAINPEWDLPRLLKETRESLGLLPEQMPERVQGAEVIKKLLGNLGALAHSLAELRNLYGTGHGKHAGAKGLEARHARLAIGASATLATFLFETHRERSQMERSG